jgi:hypothetical protein
VKAVGNGVWLPTQRRGYRWALAGEFERGGFGGSVGSSGALFVKSNNLSKA